MLTLEQLERAMLALEQAVYASPIITDSEAEKALVQLSILMGHLPPEAEHWPPIADDDC
jgi:hypothetical protein